MLQRYDLITCHTAHLTALTPCFSTVPWGPFRAQTERTGQLSLAQKESPKFQVSTEKGILGGGEQRWRYCVPQTLAPREWPKNPPGEGGGLQRKGFSSLPRYLCLDNSHQSLPFVLLIPPADPACFENRSTRAAAEWQPLGHALCPFHIQVPSSAWQPSGQLGGRDSAPLC